MSASVTRGLAGFPAPAKLNLMLRVVGRRADGYHLLQTVFRFIDYGDTVRLRVRQDGIIARVQPLPGIAEADDLTVRAARALQAATGTSLGADIAVDKRLPTGGGLGGGSSDAATTLLALNHLWQTGLARKRLQDLALPLGADVPVFVFGRTASASGVGELLAPLAVPPAWYLVLMPPVAVSTAGIFQHPELKRDSEPIKMHGFSIPAGNDLEPLVCRLYPEVARHLAWLKSVGAAQMTGSGACLFAAFADEAGARQALASCPSDMRGFVARGLDMHPLYGLADWLDE
ncbi:MAG: 4-(cytidine 5'-diphospho)-2-C-methyl-D-erythritol kinase [Betaproteobacteria bacterium]|nr:MAG: 4-(cytidine 5'-diphospho)-2-C-methyl-D-erythritol kinase [Betaproteobacteria bacterium]